MTPEQVCSLDHGLYRLHWKSGGTSLAAVGSDEAGWRWYAPSNWITHSRSRDENRLISDWTCVERVELIRSTCEEGSTQ
jgi:hypothetical protein